MPIDPKTPSRRTLIKGAFATGAVAAAATTFAETPSMTSTQTPTAAASLSDRDYWLSVLTKVSSPVLEALAKNQLRATMPVECVAGELESRRACTHLEAFGRLLCGLAPWLELEGLTGPEAAEQARLRDLGRKGIANGTNPASPDLMNFGTNQQSLVDAAFLALAIVRAPQQLWHKLDRATQQNLVRSLHETARVFPNRNNWLLFAAMVETCLCFMGETWDHLRVDYAFHQHEQWYVGDGAYGDGPHFHWDYYNSFVIQPMMLAMYDGLDLRREDMRRKDTRSKDPNADRWDDLRVGIMERAQRYAAIQERLISPEATFPVMGRSLAYRFGAFQHLADTALRHHLPAEVSPQQVRAALTAVIHRMIEAPGTFDAHGWLTIGFAGHQPSIGEIYISTGSLYLCASAFLPLGLPPADPFWSAPPKPWTSKAAWGGTDLPPDHAIQDHAITG